MGRCLQKYTMKCFLSGQSKKRQCNMLIINMIVNEINEIYLVLILFTCIYKYHIFKLFPISYELSYKPNFSKQQCILISDLQIRIQYN